MMYTIRQNPAPKTSSDLTGRKRKDVTPMAVTFRKKRNGSKKRTRRVARRAVARSSYPRARKNPKRARKSTTRRTTAVSQGVHRPRLTYKRGKWYGGSSARSLIKRGSGTRVNPVRKRRSKRVRRNPASGIKGLKRMFTQKMIMATAKTGAGIAIGFTAMPILYRVLPAALKNKRQYLGGVHVALGLALAGFIKNRHIKDVGLVIAATGVYDLIAMNIEFLGLPPLRTTSPLADRLIPQSGASEAQAGGYGRLSASYPVGRRPVSAVAQRGMGSSYEKMGSSYGSLAYPTVGLSDDLGIGDCIN